MRGKESTRALHGLNNRRVPCLDDISEVTFFAVSITKTPRWEDMGQGTTLFVPIDTPKLIPSRLQSATPFSGCTRVKALVLTDASFGTSEQAAEKLAPQHLCRRLKADSNTEMNDLSARVSSCPDTCLRNASFSATREAVPCTSVLATAPSLEAELDLEAFTPGRCSPSAAPR
jgi:hypothetical protein